MDAFKGILEGVLNQFVCEDGGLYRGQCPQLPKYVVRACGGDWPGATGHGYQTVDRVVQIGGYYGESSRGYRICSCDVAGSPYGHTWVEVNLGGQWVIYEQNAGRAGVPTADFGVGTVYAVSKTNNRGSWRLNVRYAGHPAIDAWIDAHQPTPPAPTPDIKVGDTVLPKDWVDYNGTPLIQTRDYYFVSEINGDRAVLRADSMDGAVYAAVRTSNLKKVNAAPAPAPSEGFKVGDVVVPTRLVDYNGTPLVQYDDTYTISEINGDRAVLTAPRNGEPVVWAAMNTKDIRKA